MCDREYKTIEQTENASRSVKRCYPWNSPGHWRPPQVAVAALLAASALRPTTPILRAWPPVNLVSSSIREVLSQTHV